MAPQRKTFPRLFLARAEPFRLVGERVSLRRPSAAITRNGRACAPSPVPHAVGAELAARCAEPRHIPRARLSRYGEDWRTDQGIISSFSQRRRR